MTTEAGPSEAEQNLSLPEEGSSGSRRTNAPLVYALAFGLLPQVISGLVGLPAGKFMKETMGLSAVAMASFDLANSIPGYFAPFFGYLRDRWSPMGMGDRGFYLVAAPLIAFACFWNGLGRDTYGHFLLGALVYTVAMLVLSTASDGVSVTLVRRYGLGSLLAPWRMIGITALAAACSVAGGYIADHFDYRRFVVVLGVSTVGLAAFGLWRPKKVDLRRQESGSGRSRSFVADFHLLLRERVFWRVVLFSVAWNINPVSSTVLFFFYRDRLHLSMESIGRLNGLAALSNLPPILAYPFLVKRFDLRRMMAIGVVLASLEYVPLLWAHNLTSAYFCCINVGLVVSFVSTGLVQILWRFCPPGIEASSLAINNILVGVVVSLTGMLGAWVIERLGLINGFTWDVLVSALSCIVVLPFVFLIPKDFA